MVALSPSFGVLVSLCSVAVLSMAPNVDAAAVEARSSHGGNSTETATVISTSHVHPTQSAQASSNSAPLIPLPQSLHVESKKNETTHDGSDTPKPADGHGDTDEPDQKGDQGDGKDEDPHKAKGDGADGDDSHKKGDKDKDEGGHKDGKVDKHGDKVSCLT